jgi:IMP dehydrogenase/GMP reductase
MPNVVTANRLVDGIVVYLAPDGGWVEELARAWLADTEEQTKELERVAAKAVAERRVVAVYPMEVDILEGVPVALSVRERIRASHRTTLTKDWYDVPL